jgi:ArsR family transcriptional regulator
MERTSALKSLAALSQGTRLDVYRLLVQAGDEGLTAGELATRTGVSAPALSFHAKELAAAGLIRSRPEGRFVIYSADYDAMGSLLAYLTENCCAGAACATPVGVACRPASTRRGQSRARRKA